MNIMQGITFGLAIILALAGVVTAIVAAYLLIRTIVGKATHGSWAQFRARGAGFLAALVLSGICGGSYQYLSGQMASMDRGDNGDLPPSETQTVDPTNNPDDITVLAGKQEDPVPLVSMTQKQINEFLADGYTLDYCDCTLYSNLEERVAAIRLVAGKNGTYRDSVAIPIPDEVLALVDQLVKTTDQTQRDELNKQIKHVLFQHIISDPAYGEMWADLIMQCDLLISNNDWLIREMAEYRSIFDGSFTALDKKSEDYGVRSKLELAYVAVPSDPKLVGLEWLLANSSTAKSGYQVTQAWSNTAVKICCILDHLEVVGFTTRVSEINYMNTSGVDALTHMAPATYQESRKSILLALPGKHSKSALDLGWNTEDQRAIKYGTPTAQVDTPIETAEPTPHPSSTPTPTPTPTPAPTPTPSTAPSTYRATIEYVREEDGLQVAPTYSKVNLLNGFTETVTSPQVKGYTPDKASVQVVINGKDFYAKVVYRPVDCKVTVHHYYIGTTTQILPDYVTTVKYGKTFSYTPPTVAGYIHTPTYISATITDTSDTGTVFTVYYGKDGEGMKNPADDPVNNSNAPEGGYPNLPGDGTGEVQPTMPPIHDFGTGGGNTPPSTPPNISQPSHDPTKPVTDPNGGNTVGGDVPATSEIPVVNDSNVVDDVSGDNFNPADDGNVDGFLGGDDF